MPSSNQAGKRGRDWPPVVRFLIAFGGLLAVAIGLAVASSSAEPSAAAKPITAEPAARPAR